MLEGELGLQALQVATDRRHSQPATAPREGHGTIARFERTVDLDRVPLVGVANVIDRHVVVLTPEERDGVEALAKTEHVSSGDLTLTLSHDPMLDTDALSGMRIGP